MLAVWLRCPSPADTAAFYHCAFDCQPEPAAPGEVALRLGHQRILLLPAPDPARRDFAGHEAGFQHLALVVPDMGEAMRGLEAAPGWSPISRRGPETLPPASGGVTAFKFRDPDGHPLEFLAFPPGAVPPCWQGASARIAGIDHSAISVADTARAVTFYAGLGFVAGGTGVNRGAEQARLDGLKGAEVEVTPLHPAGGGPPHLELLRYRHPAPRPVPSTDGSAAATELALLLPGADRPRNTADPDGHRLLLLPAPPAPTDRAAEGRTP